MVFRAQQIASIAVIVPLLIVGMMCPCHAYHVIGAGYQWPQPGGMNTPITLTYSFQNMFDGGIRGPGAIPDADGRFHPDGPPLPYDLIRHSIEQALGLWASVVPVNYVEVPDTDLQHGQIRFRHIPINGIDPPDPQLPVAKAQAYFPGFGTTETDVEFDEGDPWQEKGTTHIPDIFGAATHEIGHTLGMNHSDDPNAVMYWIFQRFQGLGTGHLSADDIAGVQTIYGAGMGSVLPLAAGLRQDIPILPDSTLGGSLAFDNAPSGKWFGSPLFSTIRWTADAGTLFSGILNLPTSFASPLTVTVGGNVIGQYGSGQSVDFQSYPGGGVRSFIISGINPLSNWGSSAFPLQIGLTSPSGGFSTTAVPEPASWVLAVSAVLFGWVARTYARRTRHHSESA